MQKDEIYRQKLLALRLTGYGIAAGALALVSGNASGQVVYSGIQNLTFDEPGILNPIDLDGDGVTDFNVGLAWDSNIFNGWSTYSAFIQNPYTNYWVGSSGGPFILSQSYMVSYYLSWSNYIESYYNMGIAEGGHFLGEGNVFVGVGFYIPEPTVTAHLGWIRVNIDPFATEFTVVDWAYETEPFGPITCGKLPAEQIPPEPVLTSPASGTVKDDFPVTITFSETVTGFEATDIVVEGGSPLAESFGTDDHKKYTVMIHPEVEGMIRIKVPGSIAADVDGNLNMPGANRLYFYFIDAPKVEITTSAEEPVNSAFDITIEFSEDVSTLGYEDILLTNGHIEPGSLVQVSPTLYTARIVPEGTGFVIVDIPANSVEDVDMNGNVAAKSLVIEADYDSPHVILHTTDSEPVSGMFKVYITFGEPVEGLSEMDLRITNGFVVAGSLSTTNNQIFTIQITPAETGEVIIEVPDDAARDTDGFGNLASEPLVVLAALPDALESSSGSLINVFPNPSGGTFNISLPEDYLNGELTLFNTRGAIVQRLDISKTSLKIDISGFPRGIYLLQVINGTQRLQRKVVLE